MRPSNTLGAIDVRWSAWVRTDSHVEDSVGNQTRKATMSRERASTMQSSGGATNCRLIVEQVSAAAVGDDLDTRVREQHPDSDGNLSGTPR